MKNRLLRLQRLPARDLAPHAGNPRRHPEAQRAVVAGSLATLGQVAPLLAYQEPDGTLRLFDGHLRASLDPDAEVTVAVTDLTEAEARQALATLDPSAAMAETDAAMLSELLAAVRADIGAGVLEADARLDGLLDGLRVPDFGPATEEEQGRLDQRAKVRCPECGYEFAPS